MALSPRLIRAVLSVTLVLGWPFISGAATAAGVTPISPVISVTPLSQGPTGSPNAVRLKGGNVVFVWQGNPSGGEDQPFMRVLKPDWAPATLPTRVNAAPDHRGWAPEAVALTSGGFAVVWESRLAGVDKQKVKARFFDKLGKPLTGDITVASNMFRKNLSEEIVATATTDGGFLATWPAFIRAFGADDSFDEMQSRLVVPPVGGADPRPASLGPIVRHFRRGYTHFYPAGARLGSGATVLAWMSDFDDGSSGDGFVVTRVRTAAGAFGPISNISPPPQPDVVQNFESDPSVAALANGGYAVAFTDRIPSQLPDIAVRIFRPDGTRGAELAVNLQREGNMVATTIVGLRGGGFVVGWTVASETAFKNRGNFIRIFNASNRAITGDVEVAGSGTGATELTALGGIGEFMITYPTAQGLRARRYVAQP